eukprot:6151987-Pleurochrysis_carterae.AAC.1
MIDTMFMCKYMPGTLAVWRVALFPSRSTAPCAAPSHSPAPCAVPLSQPGALRCPACHRPALCAVRLVAPSAMLILKSSGSSVEI